MQIESKRIIFRFPTLFYSNNVYCLIILAMDDNEENVAVMGCTGQPSHNAVYPNAL